MSLLKPTNLNETQHSEESELPIYEICCSQAGSFAIAQDDKFAAQMPLVVTP